MYSSLIRQREDFVSGMFVRNAINDLKQHELSMHTISSRGKSFPKIDTIVTMVVCCVGNVITHSTENTNSKHKKGRSYYGNIWKNQTKNNSKLFK